MNGRWEMLTGAAPPEFHHHHICNICGYFAPCDMRGKEYFSEYCPHCGSYMENNEFDEDEKGNDRQRTNQVDIG